jgi:hypothetical protein
LPLAAVVHVRHETDQSGRAIHFVVRIAAHVVGAGRNVEVVSVRREDGVDHMLRHIPFRVEHQADL